MSEQPITEQPVELAEHTVENSAEPVVQVPLQSPVKRVVRKPAEKKLSPVSDTVPEVSGKGADEATTGVATIESSMDVAIEKLAGAPMPETNGAEAAFLAPEIFTSEPVALSMESAMEPAVEPVVARTIQSAEFKPVQPPGPDPRRRLRELLAIPDRDRTDALWDELIELEIQLAPGNRVQSPNIDVNTGRHQKPNRFADQTRRTASSPNHSGRHHRPHAAHGSVPNAGSGGPGVAAPHGTGGADTPRPAKRFFKKNRRGPRPPDKT